MTRDLIANNMINDLEVLCPNNGMIYIMTLVGCPWKDSLLNLCEHNKNCYFDNEKMPARMKNAFSYEEEKKPEFDDDNKTSQFLSFNSNVGLKARLYQKNKELMEKVITSNDMLYEKENRDSLLLLLDDQYK